MRPVRPLTIAQRTELLVREELVVPLKGAGFRKQRLAFRRTHGELVQLIQFYPATTVSGGASPPKGFMRTWVGCGPASELEEASSEADCPVHFELRDLVRDARSSWEVPMTRGPNRVKVGAGLRREIEALLDALEGIEHVDQLPQLVATLRANRGLEPVPT